MITSGKSPSTMEAHLVWSTVGRRFHKEFKEYQGKGKGCFDTFSVAAVELSSEGARRRIEEALNLSGALAMFTGGFCFRRIHGLKDRGS